MSNISLTEINHIYSNSNKKPEKFISYPLRKKKITIKHHLINEMSVFKRSASKAIICKWVPKYRTKEWQNILS